MNLSTGHFVLAVITFIAGTLAPVLYQRWSYEGFSIKQPFSVDWAINDPMDGRGRALDNVFIERLSRSVKYENIYLNDYQSVSELSQGLQDYFVLYNTERPHSELDGQTPADVHQRSKVQA